MTDVRVREFRPHSLSVPAFSPPSPCVLPAFDPRHIEMLARMLHAAGVRHVRFECADLHGIARSKLVPLARFATVARDGVGIGGGLFRQDIRTNGPPPPAGPTYARAERGDLLLRPDFDTLAVLPWASGVARVLCSAVYPDGTPAPQDPRNILRRLLTELAHAGFAWRAGFEYEFWACDVATGLPAFGDRQYCASLRSRFHPAFVDALLDSLPALGVRPATFHAEYAPGQLELTCEPGVGLATVDAAFGVKGAAKEVALAHGLRASFMTVPDLAESAAGGHVHQSLIALVDDEVSGETGSLTAATRRFLAGQLRHAPALTALLAPTMNCFRRFRPRRFAPTHACWGFDNRSCAARVVGVGSAARIESRIGSAAANPYLAAAGLVAAGLLGLMDNPPLPAPVAGDASAVAGLPPLPTSLNDALHALEADQPLRAMLGEPLVEGFVAAKRLELGRAREAGVAPGTPAWDAGISPWEREEYFEFL